MHKKLIALAVASLAAGSAFAQTNVTLYGIADIAYVYGKGNAPRGMDDPSFSGLTSGAFYGSRLGVKGSEALGNGLKAVFTLEYGLDIDVNEGVGTGGLNARQQFVGLSSDKLGTIALGRQYAPAFVATANNDAMEGATFDPQYFLSSEAGNTIVANSAARWDNAVTYTSPNWSGFTGKAIYSFGESSVTKSTSANGKFGLGANYSSGPLNVDLVYQSRQNVVATAIAPTFTVAGTPPNTTITGVPGVPAIYTGKNIDEGYIGASYDFKVVKIMGSYQAKNDKTALDADNQVWSLGAVIPVLSASNVHISYGELDWDQDGTLSALNGNSQAAALGWTTNLSKRTRLYTAYTWTTNDRDSIGAQSEAMPYGVGYPGETNNSVVAGITHVF